MDIRNLMREGERLGNVVKVPKAHYKCPFCSRRFKEVPQRSRCSPYPSCPSCGIPVAEIHRIQSFDRTRRIFSYASIPVFTPFRLTFMTLGLVWSAVKVGGRGLWRAMMFFLTLPLSVVREYRKKRFATPEALQKHLDEVRSQWGKNEALPREEGPYTEVLLSPLGRTRFIHSDMNSHNQRGTVVSSDTNPVGLRVWFIKWSNGKVGGPYKDEDIRFV